MEKLKILSIEKDRVFFELLGKKLYVQIPNFIECSLKFGDEEIKIERFPLDESVSIFPRFPKS